MREIGTEAIGERFTKRLIDGARRARLKDTRGDLALRDKNNKRCSTPRSAVTPFDVETIREENDVCTATALAVYLHLLQWARPFGSRGTWRVQGYGKQARELYHVYLAKKVGLSVRQFDRYLALLRTLGLVSNHQPPRDENRKGKRVHEYQVYEFAEVSREHVLNVQRWFGRSRAQEANTTCVAQSGVPPRVANPATVAVFQALYYAPPGVYDDTGPPPR